MITSPSVNLVTLAAAGLAASVSAHSNMILPLPTWPVSWSTNSPSGLIEGDTYLPVPDGMSHTTDPYDNTEAYWTAFNASNYTSLLEFAKETQVLQTMATFGTATAECGFSLANGTARDLPVEVEWNQLTSSHEGPCEVWCDDTLVFEDWNCAVDYTSDPAKPPYDKSKCEGASMLTSYWIALHGLPWQVYLNCVPLTGKVNGTAYAVAGESDSTQTQTTTTAPSTATTDAPETATESSSASDDTTAPEAPETSIESSSASTDSSTTKATEAPATDAPEVETPEVTPATPTVTTATPTATEPTSQTDNDTSGAKCSSRRK